MRGPRSGSPGHLLIRPIDTKNALFPIAGSPYRSVVVACGMGPGVRLAVSDRLPPGAPAAPAAPPTTTSTTTTEPLRGAGPARAGARPSQGIPLLSPTYLPTYLPNYLPTYFRNRFARGGVEVGCRSPWTPRPRSWNFCCRCGPTTRDPIQGRQGKFLLPARETTAMATIFAYRWRWLWFGSSPGSARLLLILSLSLSLCVRVSCSLSVIPRDSHSLTTPPYPYPHPLHSPLRPSLPHT